MFAAVVRCLFLSRLIYLVCMLLFSFMGGVCVCFVACVCLCVLLFSCHCFFLGFDCLCVIVFLIAYCVL